MRARYKAPAGTGTLELSDDATIGDIFSQIQAKTGLTDISLRYGWPLRTLDASLRNTPAKELRLNGETFTVVPAESEASSASASTPAPASSSAPPRGAAAQLPVNRAPLPSTQAPEDITVPWPEREGTLLVRVMPSDNSCLFTAFGGALPNQPTASVMRQRIADYITARPQEYNEAILGMPPVTYCQKITSPHYWGGAIEISIFSNIFDVEICTYNVKEKNLMRFGEGKDSRCILVYSGIHYDRVAFSPSEPPYTTSQLPPEVDQTIWDTSDDTVLAQAHLLVEKLYAVHYYTDPSEILLRCDHPGCDWLGSGEVMGQRHARETGHTALTEIDDTDEDSSVLLRCQHDRCEWLGGLGAAKTHGVETGHTKLVIIPDF